MVPSAWRTGRMISSARDVGTTPLPLRTNRRSSSCWPYLTAKLDENFYFDARAAWGRSSNRVSPFGTFEDTLDATRWLATGALIGEFTHGAYRIRPELRLAYFREESENYTDKLGNQIPSINVETGTLEFGPTISTKLDIGPGMTVMPNISFKGIWTFLQENEARDYAGDPGRFADTGLRGELGLGVDIASANGATLGLSGSYDGIGDGDYEAWSAMLRIGQRW